MDGIWKLKINSFLTKAVVLNLYIFASGVIFSQKTTNVSGLLICLFGLFQMIIMRENPLIKIKDKTLNLPILIHTLSLLISFISHPYPEVFSEFHKLLLLFLFFYIVVVNIHDLKHVKNLITIASIMMGASGIYGLYQHYILKHYRIEGFTFELSFGCLLAIFITFLLVYSLWGKINIKSRIALFTGIPFLGANLLFTLARGAWFGLLGGIITLTWIKNKKLLILMIIFILALYLFLPPVYIDRFKSSFDTKTNDSNLVRIALWKGALSMYREHFITGIGLDRFEEEYHAHHQQKDLYIGNPCHAHNNLLHLMAEAGTLGGIAFIWLMVSVVIWLYKNYKQIPDPNWRLFPLASLCGIISFNIQGLTTHTYGNGHTIRFFWFLIALNMIIANLCKKDSNQNEQISSE